MKVLRLVMILLILLLAYFLFFPVPVEPVAWQPDNQPPLEGHFAVNTKLSAVEHLLAGQCPECEDVAIDSLGRIYGSAVDGRILRFETADSPGEVVAETSGRPLGLDFDHRGHLIIADARKGLLSLDPSDGTLKVLATSYEGSPFRFTDDVEVGPDSVVYFSDASYKFSIEGYKLDIVEHRPNGRLLAYHPQTGALNLLLDSLYFANGVAVSANGDFVLVNETGAYRVKRYWLTGPRRGQQEILIDNLPGFPDGISRGSDGVFWLTLVSPRNALLDQFAPNPFIRKMLIRLPSFLQPKPQAYGFVLGLDAEGRVIYNLQDPRGIFQQITSVQEYDGQLYLGSLAEHAIGRIKRPR